MRRRVRQIDCVTVKGSNRPMGLFTYDVTLERIAAPDRPSSWASPAAGLSRRESLASSTASASAGATLEPIDGDPVSYSLSAYNWEFSDHPDLANTWAVDQVFLDHFARVRATRGVMPSPMGTHYAAAKCSSSWIHASLSCFSYLFSVKIAQCLRRTRKFLEDSFCGSQLTTTTQAPRVFWWLQ